MQSRETKQNPSPHVVPVGQVPVPGGAQKGSA
jgi:hypothetical protein